MNSATEARLLLATFPAHTGEGVPTSRNLVQSLVTEGLAACVNRVPSIVSAYLWENELHEDEEELLLIKTSKQNVQKLMARIEALHPYDIPEILVVNIEDGLPAYLKWVDEQCSSKKFRSV